MRKLNTRDAFKFMQILRIAGMKEEFAQIIEMTGKSARDTNGKVLSAEAKAEAIGARVFGAFFDLLGNEATEGPVCALLAGIAGKTQNEIMESPISDTVQLIQEIATENDISSFFK